MTTLLTIPTASPAETLAIAAALARQCRAGDCILLRGELGGGKTTFARGFIQALQDAPEEVVSPTFTLAQTYPARGGLTIWHFDFYRLKKRSEAAETGLSEALASGIVLIEWPEIIQSELPATALNVTITHGDRPEQRLLTFAGQPGIWQGRLDRLKENEG